MQNEPAGGIIGLEVEQMDNSQELITRLNHSGRKLSKSHQRIAECIVAHYDKVVFMTASKLAEYVGVSESTVVRFATALGYSGYPQLQRSLQELIRHQLTASQRFEMTDDMDHAQVLNKVLKADIRNIRSTLEGIDIGAFEKAVDSMITARRIYVLGQRASAPIAEFFAHYLRFIFPNVQVVTSGISDVFEQIARITQEDVLIGFSFPRYTKRTIETMEFAASKGAATIAVTDGPMSPLYRTADIRLVAKSDMASFVDSLAAPLSLVNALIVALAQRRRSELSEYFANVEKIWSRYDVYLARGEDGEKNVD